MFKTVALLALVGLAQAGYSTGSCPTPSLQAAFDATRYMGLWYEQARDKTMPWESNDCQQARYTLNADGTVGVHNTQYNPSTDLVDGATAVATFDGAKGAVSFFWYAPAGDYEVLATDYSNYAIVYSCSSFYFAKSEYVWLLTRQQTIDDSVMFKALQTLKEKVPDYDQTNIYRTYQGATCKYLSNEASA
jgi:apolipoprotein D and lipocalin family protein